MKEYQGYTPAFTQMNFLGCDDVVLED